MILWFTLLILYGYIGVNVEKLLNGRDKLEINVGNMKGVSRAKSTYGAIDDDDLIGKGFVE